MPLVVVRVNENYRASVYDVADLKRYVNENPDQIDHSLLAVEDRETFHEKLKHLKEDESYLKLKAECIEYVQSILEPNKAITAPKIGWQYKTLKEITQAQNAQKDSYEKEFNRDKKLGAVSGIIRWQYRGIGVVINGERDGDLDCGYYRMERLKRIVAEAEAEHPNAEIEVYIEGRYDWFESYQAMFAKDYEPSDFYTEVTVYKNF
jgi:hypothetical protein